MLFLLKEHETFHLPPKLAQNYKIDNNINNIKHWKAKILVGNNVSDEKIGDWDSVGYIAINLDSNIIVPLARGDEHQSGYDALWELGQKNLIPNGKYSTFWPHSEHYIYEKDIEKQKLMLKKWLSYGGSPNVKLNLYYVNNYNQKIVTIGEYLQGESSSSTKRSYKKINHSTEMFLKDFKRFIELSFDPIREEQNLRHYASSLFDWADYEIKNIFGHTPEWLAKLELLMVRAEGKDDINAIIQIVLGHPSLKNELHRALKTAYKTKKDLDKYDLIFGNTRLMIQHLTMLGNINN